MKPRIHTYTSHENHVRLHAAAARPGKSLWEIVDDALTEYFDGNSEKAREARLARRLDRLSRQFDRLEQKNTVVGETLALFIRYFLMVTPELPVDHIDAARAKGDEQFDAFLEQLARDLQAGHRILQRAVDDAIPEKSAFFSQADLDRLDNPAPDRESKTSDAEIDHA